MSGRRLVVITCTAILAVLLMAPPSSAAGRPQRDSDSFSFVDRAPAGELCDFAYRGTGSILVTTIAFVDPDGEVVHDITHAVGTFTHTNVETGTTLTERLVLNARDDFVTGTGTTVGIQWHLKDAAGHGVLTVAGRLTYSLDPFEIQSITPRVDEFLEFPRVICAALGGSAA